MQVAQLGLGTGALTKFTHLHCPAVKNTVVEVNPAVIGAANPASGCKGVYVKPKVLSAI
jgi:spermidine synthase